MKPTPRRPAQRPNPVTNGDPTTPATPARRRTGRDRTPAAATDRSPYAESLVELCAATPRLQAFSAAIRAAGLGDLFGTEGPITVFAPTDVAFSKVPEGQLTKLMGDQKRLTALLKHHVVPGRVKAPRARNPRTATPMFGDPLRLTETADGFYVDEVRIVRTNIRGVNGVIHAIDTVLDPG